MKIATQTVPTIRLVEDLASTMKGALSSLPRMHLGKSILAYIEDLSFDLDSPPSRTMGLDGQSTWSADLFIIDCWCSAPHFRTVEAYPDHPISANSRKSEAP